MRLESYPEAKKMPEKYLPSLVDAEIECWGSEPFSEYRICKNDGCKAIFSIEDVYGSVEEFQKRRELGVLDNTFCCEECGGETEYVYEKGEFMEVIKNYFQGTVSSILLLGDNDNVRGFGVVSKKSILELLSLELNTRPGSYDKNQLLNNLSENIFGLNFAGNNEIIYFNHLFVGEEHRNDKYGGLIMQKMLKLVKYYNDIPSIVETKKYSNVYYYMKRLGYNDSLEDKYGYIVMYLKKDNCSFKSMLNNLSNSKNNMYIPNSSYFLGDQSDNRLYYV